MVIAKYELIYRELRDQILSERYLDGKLPPLQKLSSAYRVNPATISKAVKQLESEGLVQCGPGSTGTIINLEQVRILQRKQIFSRSNFHQKSVHLRYCLPASGDILYAKLVEDFQSLYPSIEIELAECTNPRRGDKIELAPARKIRYRERSTVERGNSDLKDNYGARHVRVKGHWKVLCHLMFGVIAITVKQLFNMLE